MGLIDTFQWIDVIALITFARISYVAAGRGLLDECSKLIALVVASFFSFQYYSLFLSSIFARISSSFNRAYLDVPSFLIIFFTIIFVCALLKIQLTPFAMGERGYPAWERRIGLALGMVRASFLVSVIVFVFSIIPASSATVTQSISYKGFKKIAPAVYAAVFTVYKKINHTAQLNKEVIVYHETQSIVSGSSKKRHRR